MASDHAALGAFVDRADERPAMALCRRYARLMLSGERELRPRVGHWFANRWWGFAMVGIFATPALFVGPPGREFILGMAVIMGALLVGACATVLSTRLIITRESVARRRFGFLVKRVSRDGIIGLLANVSAPGQSRHAFGANRVLMMRDKRGRRLVLSADTWLESEMRLLADKLGIQVQERDGDLEVLSNREVDDRFPGLQPWILRRSWRPTVVGLLLLVPAVVVTVGFWMMGVAVVCAVEGDTLTRCLQSR